jgi:serine/threonine protein kinase
VEPPFDGLLPGQIYAGWLIERELASGGMGVIYLGQHPRLPRTDVIKVLKPVLSNDPRFRERFLAEANRMSALSHPNVMPIHDSGQAEDGSLYLVMPYVTGGDLRQLLNAGVLPPLRASRLISQLASALDAAHRIGVVHRDVKPENVLLAVRDTRDADHAILTDFGISRETAVPTTLTATGELLLTPAYAAPEQALGKPVDARTDQYALGCVLVELLTGKPPYGGGAPLAVLMAHVQQPVPTIAARLKVPIELDRVLERALAKDPENRYSDCREFAGAVAQVLGQGAAKDQTVSIPPPSVPSKQSRKPRRFLKRRRTAAAVSTLVLIGGGAGLAATELNGSHAKTSASGPASVRKTARPAATKTSIPNNGICVPVAGTKLVTLADDKNTQILNNLVPVVNKDFARAPLTAALNDVSATIEQSDLEVLDATASASGQSPSSAAASFVSVHNIGGELSGGSGNVIIGALSSPESQVLADVYRDVLNGIGYTTTVKTFSDRDHLVSALEAKTISVAPEYTARLNQFLGSKLGIDDGSSDDPTQTARLLNQKAAMSGLVVLNPSDASDPYAFAVTANSAAKYDLARMSDIASKCGNPLNGGAEIAAPSVCAFDVHCLEAIDAAYGVSSYNSLDSDGPLTRAALTAGKTLLGLVSATDPDLSPAD